MATAPLVFPTLPSGKRLDSSKMSTDRTDPGMKQEAEGGYVITRARFTRKPRKKFKCGFTMITQADKVALDEFWDLTRGSSRIFAWTCPFDATTYQVRFTSTLAMGYQGVGNNHFWNCDFDLEQA